MATNQSGIERGIITPAQVDAVHERLLACLFLSNVQLDAFYICPHHPDAGCDCRKPKPGLLLRAIRDFQVDPAVSYMAGNQCTDVMAAQAAGVRPIFIGASDCSCPRLCEAYSSLLAFSKSLAEGSPT